MPYNPNIHHRQSIRLKGYNYSQAGLYFITICTQNRECLFGEIINGKMLLNDAGMMIETEWLNIKNRFTNIELHEYVTMPNHFHAILEIVGATLVVAQNQTVAQNNDEQQNDGQQNDGQQNDGQQNDGQQNDGQQNDGQQNDGQQNDGQQNDGQPQGIAPTGKTLGDMMDAFKSITTVEYIRGVKTLGWQPFNGKLWQRNYWEHIIRNQNDYNRIAEYIINNPQNWENDKLKS